MAEFHSGFTGTATINGTEVPLKGWSVDPVAEVYRTRNSMTAGYSAKETTYQDATFSLRIDYDFDGSIFASPLSIVQGDTITNVKLILRGGTGGTAFWLFPSAIVTGTPMALETEGGIDLTINCEADGAFTAPTV
jgi:hypothetical protein